MSYGFAEIRHISNSHFIFSLVRSSIIYGLHRLVLLRTCSFTTTKVCFEPKREYSISGTFVHFRELFTDFGFRYSCLETNEKHERLDSHEFVFQFIMFVSSIYNNIDFLPYLDGVHLRPFAGAVEAGWSWTCVFLMLLRLQTVNKWKISNFGITNNSEPFKKYE